MIKVTEEIVDLGGGRKSIILTALYGDSVITRSDGIPLICHRPYRGDADFFREYENAYSDMRRELEVSWPKMGDFRP